METKESCTCIYYSRLPFLVITQRTLLARCMLSAIQVLNPFFLFSQVHSNSFHSDIWFNPFSSKLLAIGPVEPVMVLYRDVGGCTYMEGLVIHRHTRETCTFFLKAYRYFISQSKELHHLLHKRNMCIHVSVFYLFQNLAAFSFTLYIH